MSFILGGMTKRDRDDEVIPIGIVFMSVGLIVVFTAVFGYFILTNVPPQTIERILPAAMPPSAPSAGEDVLLP